MNEIGKRLGYEVQNGRYQGVGNQSGFDGLWFDGTNHIFAFQRWFRLDIRSGILATVGRFARFAVVELGKADLGVGVNERLLVDSPHVY